MESAAGPSWPSDVAMEPRSVLVVDDDRAIRNSMSELLESEGYKVATAANGRDALNQLAAGLRPHVIVLDLLMHEMDGWDFRYEQMKDDELKDIPVVVITAAGFSEVSVKAQFGDIEFVPKPPSEQALLGAIRRRCRQPIH